MHFISFDVASQIVCTYSNDLIIISGQPRLVNHDGIVEMVLRLHVLIEQGLAHKARPAHKALVRLLVRVHEAVRIAIVTAVERLVAHLTLVRLLAGVDAAVLLEVFRVDEGGVARLALVRTFARVRRLHVVVQKSDKIHKRL